MEMLTLDLSYNLIRPIILKTPFVYFFIAQKGYFKRVYCHSTFQNKITPYAKLSDYTVRST